MRDFESRFIGSATLFLPNIASAVVVEVIAMREGLALANRLVCNNVLTESDLIETIQACTGEESWWGESSMVFADCIDIATMVGRVNSQHCSREANGVAHELAKGLV